MTPRPTRTDPAMRQAAVEAIWPGVKAWLKSAGDALPDEWKHELIDVARVLPGDGYTIARGLEVIGWKPDDDLVDVLRGYGPALERELEAAVRAWEAEHGDECGATDPVAVHVGERLCWACDAACGRR